MLYTYNNTSQTLAQNAPIVFNTNGVAKGCSVTHVAGSTSVNINRAGVYMVQFNADAVGSGTAGNLTAQLYGNGAVVTGAESTAYSGAATDIMNLSFTALVRVNPNCCAITDNIPYVLTVQNTGEGATYSNAAITVTKVC